jgi:hypothetical protein
MNGAGEGNRTLVSIHLFQSLYLQANYSFRMLFLELFILTFILTLWQAL